MWYSWRPDSVGEASDTGGMPNSRQWALLIWIGVGLIFALTQPGARRNLRDFWRALGHLGLLGTLVGYLGVIGLAIWGAQRVGLWNTSLVADSVIWLFISGWALFGGFDEVGSRPGFFVTHVRHVIGFSLLAEFVVDIAVLPFWAELALVPFLFFLGAMLALAGRDPENALVGRVLGGCLTVTGLFLLGFGVVTLIADWDSTDWAGLGRQAVLPVWFTLAVLPYVYLLGGLRDVQGFLSADGPAVVSWMVVAHRPQDRPRHIVRSSRV